MKNKISQLIKKFAIEVNEIYEDDKVGAHLFALIVFLMTALILFILSLPFFIGGWWGLVFYGIFIFVFFIISISLKFIAWYGRQQ